MKSLTFCCITVIFFTACTKDFVVKKLEGKQVSIIAPANNLLTPDNDVIFWWEEMEGAEKYNLQIVKPNFSSVQKLIADTNISGTKFNIVLSPGSYQWRIKGVNNGGSSAYTTYNLTIDTSSNLSFQLVVPLTPVNNYLTGNTSVSFSWNSIASAEKYQIQVVNSFSTIVKDTTTTLTSYTSSLAGGAYTWKVRAMNDFSISQYNTPLTFTIDLAPPAVSVLFSPIHASSVKDTVSLKWIRNGTDTRYDSLYVSVDSAFTSIISTAKVYATQIKINALNPLIPPASAYYWWRVKSIDSVGNKSGFSNQLKFKLIN